MVFTMSTLWFIHPPSTKVFARRAIRVQNLHDLVAIFTMAMFAFAWPKTRQDKPMYEYSAAQDIVTLQACYYYSAFFVVISFTQREPDEKNPGSLLTLCFRRMLRLQADGAAPVDGEINAQGYPQSQQPCVGASTMRGYRWSRKLSMLSSRVVGVQKSRRSSRYALL